MSLAAPRLHSLAATPDFTLYVADPISSIHHFEHRIKELSEKYRSLAQFIE